MTFYKNHVVILLELVMFKKINIKAIKDSIALLMIAAVVGTIVSFVAQIFMIGAKNIYNFIFNNKDFIFNIDIGNISLNLVPLIIFMPGSILLALLIYNLKNLDGLVIKIKFIQNVIRLENLIIKII